MSLKRGRFIVVEGPEGAGKSTAINFIYSFLKERFSPQFIREPGGTQLGESIRTLIKDPNLLSKIDPRAELLLFYASRVQLVQEVIKPALYQGQWILCDRFELSTFAYQGGGRGLSRDFIHELSKFCLEGFQPDLLIFMDVPPHVGMKRAVARGVLDRMELESNDFFMKVYEVYQEELKKFKHVIHIDATQSLEVVQSQILNALKTFVSDYG